MTLPLRPRRRCLSRTLAAAALTSAAALLACEATITRGYVPAASPAIDKSVRAAASRRQLLSGLSILGVSQVADSRSALAKTQKIEILIDKPKDASLGVLFDDSPEAQKVDGLIIKAVNPDGLVQQWNKQNPDKAIIAEDILVGANKMTSKQQIVNECKGQKKLNLKFVRLLGDATKIPDDIRIKDYDKVPGMRMPDLNGRWSIALFGKKVNGQPVYKRAGEDFYLVLNKCGQYQMSADATGECNGFCVKTEEGWKYNGQLMPNMKQVAYKDEGPDPYAPTEGYDKFIYDEGRGDPRNKYLYD